MNKRKFLIIFSFAVLVACLSIGSISAVDNSTSDNLNVADDAGYVEVLSAPEETNSLSKCQEDNSTLSVGSSDEKLELSNDSSDNVLSTSVSVSSGHTFYKNGYKFKVSDSKYKQIKKAIKAGKKQTFLDWGFKFTVKTNKFEKVKVFVKKTVYKKVLYDGLTKSHKRVIFNNLKSCYDAGWQRYLMSYKEAKNSNKYLAYHYVHFKKTIKTYKTVKMRVFATISYEGSYDYDDVGPHYFYPVVEFDAKRAGYSPVFLSDGLLGYN